MIVETDHEIATLAAGCFWGVEAALLRLPGVIDTEVGYTGGHVADPTYELVCSDTTGHAEAVRLVVDAGRLSFSDLLTVFWEIHDPTTPNRQGLDIGSQYRSAIFTHSADQELLARRFRAAAARQFDRPVVTQILPAGPWWRAEEDHQRYFDRHGVE